MDTSAPSFKHFRLVHQLSRRIRIVSPLLKNDRERGYIFEILLKKRPEIKKVRSVFAIGSVAIEFDAARLPKANLLIMLDAILGNLAMKSPQRVKAGKKTFSGAVQEIDLAVDGMTCASCALLIEMVLNRDERIKTANVNFATETVTVHGELGKEDVRQRIERLGYSVYSIDTLSQRRNLIFKERQRISAARKRFVWAAMLSLPVVAMAMTMGRSRWLPWLQFLFTTPVVFAMGRPFFVKAALLARQRSANMDSLIALGVGSAYFYSLTALFRRSGHLYFEAAAAIITFVLLGRYLEERARGKAGEAIRKLVDLQPQTATLLRDGREITVALDAVQAGDVMLVRPGEKIPTDGVVVFGLSSIDEALITGESMPVVKEAGAPVIGGCVNGNGMLHIRATAVGMDTVLAGIVHMVDQAQAAKLPIQKQVDKISAVFVPTVMAIAAATFSAWMLTGASLAFAFGSAISVLLIACPCALGLATPAAIMVGTGQAARKGIYIRNGESLEVATKLNAIVFDKTGTITEGRPKISDICNVSQLSEEKLIGLAASAENNSEHFLARAVVDYAKESAVSMQECSHFYSRPGRGIEAEVTGYQVLLGNLAWMDEKEIEIARLRMEAGQLAEQGKTPVYLAIDGILAAVFGISDKPRESAKVAIARLHERGLETLMVTGDTEKTARHIAARVGIEDVLANARPDEKLAIILELQQEGKQVGMIGDGINDAPALAAADVGFAIGGGTDIANESADLTLVGGDITRVADAISLSTDTIGIIKQNLFWAFGYNTVAIPVAAMGRLNPMIAAAAMALSSVSVIINSLRLSKQ